MKLFRYKAEIVDTIAGRDLDEANQALFDWLNANTERFKISDIEEIGDAW